MATPGGLSLPFATVAALLLSCGSGEAATRFEARFADGAAPPLASLSVLGVFRDGVISEQAWPSFGSGIAQALHRSTCAVGYGDELRSARPDVFSAVSQDSRRAGLSNELLAAVAPAARGEAILVFEVFGRPTSEAAEGQPTRIMVAQHMGHGSHGDLSNGASGVRSQMSTHTPAFEISATIFSAELRRPLAYLTMEYRGPSAQTAIEAFAQNLSTTFPRAVCSGWDWSALAVVNEYDDAGLPTGSRLVPAEHD